MSKILFTADIHFSNSLPGAIPGENGVTNRLQDQINLFDELCEIVREEKITDVFVLGDIFDKSIVDPITLTTAMNCFRNLSNFACVQILSGNHDSNGNERYLTEVFCYLNDIVLLDNVEKFQLENGIVIE